MIIKMDRDSMIQWLREKDQSKVQTLIQEAYRVKLEHVGNKVYFRGIIELSNICTKNCFYCGIRRSASSKTLALINDSRINS